MPLKPREIAPPLTVKLVGGDTYTLGKEPPDNFSLVVHIGHMCEQAAALRTLY